MKSILLVVIARAWLVIAGGRSLYLYEKDSDPILEYKGDAKNDFTKSTKPRFVEFYSPHCPACVHFKPVYIEMAKQLQQDYSSSDIEFYAVSCDAQPEICSKLEIEDTPSMFAFQKGSTQRIKVSRDETTEEYTTEQLAGALNLPTGGTATASRRMDDTPSFGKDKNKEDASNEDGDDDDDDDDDKEEDKDGDDDDDDDDKEEEKNGDDDDDDDDKDEETKGDDDDDDGDDKDEETNGDDDDDDDGDKEEEKKGDDDDDDKKEQKGAGEGDDAGVPTKDDNKLDKKAENEHDAKRKDKESKPSGETAEKVAKPVDNKGKAKDNDPKAESSNEDKKVPQEKPSKPDKEDKTKGKTQDDDAAKKEAKENEKEVKGKDISKGIVETDETTKTKADSPKMEEKKSENKEKQNKSSENKDNKAKGPDDKAADASTTGESEKAIEEGATMRRTDSKKQKDPKHSDSPKPEEESPDDNQSATNEENSGKEENSGEVENPYDNNADAEEDPNDENESKDENDNESQDNGDDDDDDDNHDGDRDDEDGRDGDDDDNDHDGDDDDDDDDDNSDADLSNDSRSDVVVPSLGGPALQRRHDAGHNKAWHQAKALDRFKDNMKSKIDVYEEKRKGLGKFIRKDKRLDPKGNLKQRQDPESMTEGMKAYTPGTPDFEKRRERMKKRLEKANKRLKNPSQGTENMPINKDALPYKKDVRKPSVIKKAIAKVPLVGKRFRMTPEEELILDVSLSLVTSLESGVIFKTRQGWTPKQTEALQNFLDLLNVALPPEWGIHKLIHDLRRRFSYITTGEANFKLILSEHPLPRQTWSSSCEQPEKGTSGFSCGFWKLLHVVTVGVADLRGGMNLLDSGLVGPQTRLFSPIDAADAIRDYINEFFTCQPCRENFVKTYDSCSNNRRCDRLTEDIESASIADWKELPLWLWEVHNEVSVRLMNEQPQRSKRLGLRDEIVVIWPSLETCFRCFHEDGTWDEAEVFKHLESTYWPDSELDPRSERLIQYDDTEQYKVGLLLWLVTFIALCFVYSLIKSTSPATLQQRLYLAKRLVRTGPGKKRSQ